MRSKYDNICINCGKRIYKGELIYYYPLTKKVSCLNCQDGVNGEDPDYTNYVAEHYALVQNLQMESANERRNGI